MPVCPHHGTIRRGEPVPRSDHHGSSVSPTDTRSPTRRRIGRVALVAGAAGVGFGGLYLGELLVSGNAIPAGTQVAGVNIEGLSRPQAQHKLDETLGTAWTEPVKVRIADRTTAINARGFSLDSAETVAHAAQSRLDPVTVIGRLFTNNDHKVEPVIRVKETQARTALARTAKAHDRKVREGAVTFRRGTATPVKARPGQSLDMDGAIKALGSAIPGRSKEPIRLPVRTAEPVIGTAEVERAMKEFATPAMSAPVTLVTGSRKVEISPATLSKHLTMKPDSAHRLKPQLDSKGLLADPTTASSFAQATDKAVNAQLRLRHGRVVVASDGEPGQEVTAKTLHKAVLPLLTRTGTAARTGAVATEEMKPKLTRDNFARLGITERMSTFTVNFERAPYRTTNIGRAAKLINGSVVLPDETWSFNRTVGERTKANGFVEGIIINNDKFEKSAGGGVSAVAATTFNAIFFAGVQPVEHGAHSFYIERYPEGREATVAWNSLDLKFKNDSGNAIYIAAHATNTSVTVTFLGNKKYDKIESVTAPRTHLKEPKTRHDSGDDCVPQTPLEGFNVAVDRVFKNGGKEVGRETYETRYVPRNEIICSGKATD
ncbi:VanW family protein [Streptomyces sp. NBC_01017]|uniref:VanW family protein n=1 Tax=Streptomyces sp. NBC_01017 TaxID=2903721 RepID=UPI003866A63E